MDWITLLRSLQSDFLKRLTSGCLLHCEIEGQYSEITIISGDRLKALREFCWLMAEKYKRTSPVRDVFINNLKGKLGEEVVKERLADFITEVDYEKRFGGDGKSDFTLTANCSLGVEVKSRHGSIDRVRWSVSAEEVAKNAVIVCILIQEEVNEAQSAYHLFLAGFLPTKMIKLKTGKISFGINQLLYGGGLFSYLEQLQLSTNPHKSQLSQSQFIKTKSAFVDLTIGDEYFQKGEYAAAINIYNQALQFNHNNADIYYKLGLINYQLGDYLTAINNYTQAININTNHSKAYNQRGLTHYQIGDYQVAIEDYTQAIRINPHIAIHYKNRADVRSHLGDNQGAIEDYNQAIKINSHYIDAYYDRGNAHFKLGEYAAAITNYTQAIKINSHYVDAYYSRGNARLEIVDKQGAVEDFQKAADLYWQEGKLAEYKDTQARIIELEIEVSLDILNF